VKNTNENTLGTVFFIVVIRPQRIELIHSSNESSQRVEEGSVNFVDVLLKHFELLPKRDVAPQGPGSRILFYFLAVL